MSDIKRVRNLHLHPCMIGALPANYLVSLSYEEQILLIGKKISEIIDFINSVLEQELNEYILNMFNDIMMKTMYDAETETLILYLDKKGE